MKKMMMPVLLLLTGVYAIAQPGNTRLLNQPMKIESAAINICADYFTATTTLLLEFSNKNEVEMEGVFRFKLNAGQVITAFQLELNGQFREGSIEEKWKATNAYNTIVGKRIDPALLQMEYPDNYLLNIYPIPAKGSRRVSITIQQAMKQEEKNAVYELSYFAGTVVPKFSLHINTPAGSNPVAEKGLLGGRGFQNVHSGFAMDMREDNFIWNQPLKFLLQYRGSTISYVKTTNEKSYFAVKPGLKIPRQFRLEAKKIAVYWDASASLADRDMDKEIAFLRSLVSYHDANTITITRFSHRIIDTEVFDAKKVGRWQQYLETTPYSGATQLGLIDLTQQDADIVLIFTDGVNTFGKVSPVTAKARVYCVSSSSNVNVNMLNTIVGIGGGSAILLKNTSLNDAVRATATSKIWLRNVLTSNGAIILKYQPEVLQNDLFIFGAINGKPDTLLIEYGTNSKVFFTEKVFFDTSNQCSSSAIDRYEMLVNAPKLQASPNWNEILDYGLREKIVTRYTAYIVLERLEDYIRYNITPPKELEEDCRKLGFVKKDTRGDRQQLQQLSRIQMLQNVAAAWNYYRQQQVKSSGRTMNTSFNRNIQITPPVEDNRLEAQSDRKSVQVTSVPNFSAQKDNSMEEVVVTTAYSVSRSQRQLSYAATLIRGNEISPGTTTVEQALAGRVAGLQVTSSVDPGATARIILRGQNGLQAESKPLFVLDGIPIEGNINDFVNVNNIESINVIKGPQASMLYGTKASGGAIVITTKFTRRGYQNNPGPYKLKSMDDMDYITELKAIPMRERMSAYEENKSTYVNDAAYHFDVAEYFYDCGLSIEAKEILLNAIEAANGNAQMKLAAAYLFEKWKDYKAAEVLYEELIKESGNWLTPYRNLAWIYFQEGKYQAAVDILFQAIVMDTKDQENQNRPLKAIMLTDLNAIIAARGSGINVSAIPVEMIVPLTADYRMVIDFSKGWFNNITIAEPNGATASVTNPVTKNRAWIFDYGDGYAHSSHIVDYTMENVVKGKYRLNVAYYDNYYNRSKIPSVFRKMVFKNFGKINQQIEVELITIDNQYGNVEIADWKW